MDTLASEGEFTLISSSALKLESTQFSSDVIRVLDSSNIPVSIANSGTISVTDGSTTKSYDTSTQPYAKTLINNGKITIITSSSTSSTSSSTSKITSLAAGSANNSQSKSNIPNGEPNNVSANRNSTQSNDKISKSNHGPSKLTAEDQAKLAQQKAQNKLKESSHSNTKLTNLQEKNMQNSVAKQY